MLIKMVKYIVFYVYHRSYSGVLTMAPRNIGTYSWCIRCGPVGATLSPCGSYPMLQPIVIFAAHAPCVVCVCVHTQPASSPGVSPQTPTYREEGEEGGLAAVKGRSLAVNADAQTRGGTPVQGGKGRRVSFRREPARFRRKVSLSPIR